jgi:hypothetical protein
MEEAAVEKSEYYEGEIFAIPGAKLAHNIISRNIFGHLINKLKGKKCQPFTSAFRVHVETFRLNEKNLWQLEEYKTRNAILSIPALQVSIPLVNIYEGTNLVQAQ